MCSVEVSLSSSIVFNSLISAVLLSTSKTSSSPGIGSSTNGSRVS